MSFKSSLGLWRMLEGPGWGWHLSLGSNMVTVLWYIHDLNFGSLARFWRRKELSCPLSPHLGLLRVLEVPDWGLVFWSLFHYVPWSLIQPWSEFWLSILILKVQRTSMSSKSPFGALEDAWGSWLGFGISIIIWRLSLVFDTPLVQILALCLDFENVKNIQVL